MLHKLDIQNYAIIEDISIEFSGKLNAITGETGAGKSILVGALSLILGARADAAVLLSREKKCFVEGLFGTEGRKEIRDFLSSNHLDADEEITIRREISANGKSRAFVNDTPVNLNQLRILSALLVDLHLQFDELELGESGFQLAVLDALAGQQDLVGYQSIFHQWSELKKESVRLQEHKEHFTREFDYNQFLFNELNETGFVADELEDLDSELKLMANAETIKSGLSKVHYDLREGESDASHQIKSALQQLLSLERWHPELPALIHRLKSVQIELQDIAEEIESVKNRVQFDSARMEEINERMSIGYKLLKKHGVRTTRELIAVQQGLETKLKAVLDLDEAIARSEKAVGSSQREAERLALILSANRKMQIGKFEEKVNFLLVQVGMPNAKLKVELRPVQEMNEFGIDAVEFLFDANNSKRFEPVRKVASGGELSRLMLCIKSLVAQSIDMPTLIFDEIDAGISGEAARQVGLILSSLSGKRQVICVTHQAQIAGKANTHYFVYKEMVAGSIKTSIRLLSREERITAIAKMLGGEKPTAAALENAKEMMLP